MKKIFSLSIIPALLFLIPLVQATPNPLNVSVYLQFENNFTDVANPSSNFNWALANPSLTTDGVFVPGWFGNGVNTGVTPPTNYVCEGATNVCAAFNTKLDLSKSWTMGGWVFVEPSVITTHGLVVGEPLGDQSNSANLGSAAIAYTRENLNPNRIQLQCGFGGATGTSVVFYSDPSVNANWNFLVGTYNSTNQTLTFYVNGTNVGSQSVPGGCDSTTKNVTVTIDEPVFNSKWNSTVDEFFITQSALDSATINNLYAAPDQVTYKNLLFPPSSLNIQIISPQNITYSDLTQDFNFKAISGNSQLVNLTGWLDGNSVFNQIVANNSVQDFSLNLINGLHNFTIVADDNSVSNQSQILFTTNFLGSKTYCQDNVTLIEIQNITTCNGSGCSWNQTTNPFICGNGCDVVTNSCNPNKNSEILLALFVMGAIPFTYGFIVWATKRRWK